MEFNKPSNRTRRVRLRGQTFIFGMLGLYIPARCIVLTGNTRQNPKNEGLTPG